MWQIWDKSWRETSPSSSARQKGRYLISCVTEKANLVPVLSVSLFIRQHFSFSLNFHSVVTDLCSQHWVSIKFTTFISIESLQLEKTFSHDKSLYGEKLKKKRTGYWKSYCQIMLLMVIYFFQHLSVLKSLESL